MKVRVFIATMLVALVAGVLVPFHTARAAQTGSVTQTLSNVPTTVNGVSGTLNGTLTITKFVTQNGQLAAVGTLTGTVTNALGTLATITNAAVTAPITAASGSCQILYLHTGEIYLNLLGLVIDIQPITIDITAQQGPGNLLGNLLCAVANLLNGGAPLASLTNLLNTILAKL